MSGEAIGGAEKTSEAGLLEAQEIKSRKPKRASLRLIAGVDRLSVRRVFDVGGVGCVRSVSLIEDFPRGYLKLTNVGESATMAVHILLLKQSLAKTVSR
jgi:hypothetical protein